MRLVSLSIALATVIGLAGTAQAYTVLGLVTCPQILEEHSNENYRAMNRWWILGYFSARNYENDADVGTGVGDEALYTMAYQYCQKNADRDWDDATRSVYESL